MTFQPTSNAPDNAIPTPSNGVCVPTPYNPRDVGTRPLLELGGPTVDYDPGAAGIEKRTGTMEPIAAGRLASCSMYRTASIDC
jgi:hypothetical protein